MNTESMRGSVIFMLLLQAAVAIYVPNCPCFDETTPISEEGCRTEMSCIDDNKKCQSDKTVMALYDMAKDADCDVTKLCLTGMIIELFAEALGSARSLEDLTAGNVEKKLRNKYSCAEKMDKNSCADEADAKKCISKMLGGHRECVNPILEFCQAEGGVTDKKAIEKTLPKPKNSGGSGETEGESNASYATQSFNYIAGMIVALLVL